MIGGGPFGFAPAEWTDDTSMAIPLAECLLGQADAVAAGEPVDWTPAVRGWACWARDAKDAGSQTRAVISAARRLASGTVDGEPSAADFLAASAAHLERTGRGGGNGSLMRTAPVALAFLARPEAELARAAAEASALTHTDPDVVDACVLWCLAIRHAVLTGELGVRVGLPFVDADRVGLWEERIAAAETSRPADFSNNGWVVEAFQGAWSAITSTAAANEGPAHLRAALEDAVRGGRDTDTVAAIAGGLLGAAYGLSSVPFEWRRRLHGWPGLRALDLQRIGMELGRGEGPRLGEWPAVKRYDYSDWVSASATDVVVHPADPGVLLGAAAALQGDGYDAVVSLCRVGTADVKVAPEDHARFWLIDSALADSNAHVEFVLRDAADAVATFRAEGKRVLLHCVRMESRTPTVAALYGAKVRGVSAVEALEEVRSVLPAASPNRAFMEVLRHV
ncbi:ADP-ribosylglycohydrolase family protein [Sinomonas sp. ASV486]|uniref:ADP-ribosylglycohydrolase family protein n=1 Tax=Sinomonas sp. ASV486 TaxID=3051170 RepID=UPI0027DD6EBF|nr:ADP-ribosylglycohydrolase family protein [Sinomonas sp. ASV486]MDQ4489040.1 ADP-ribosylglycohydrolase family protein [Sinomonas sp. ASV486]